MSDDQRNHEPPGLASFVRKEVVVPLVALIAVLGLLTVFLAGRSTKTPLPGGASKSSPANGLAGFRVTPVEPAPGLSLPDYRGKLVNLSAYRGKAVLVTFLYTHCPDVCPLIASNLRVAQAKLGAEGSKLQIVAVSVDPHGDTPHAVAAFLKAHEMTGRMEYLLGSGSQLASVWKAWKVGSQRDTSNPEFVAHSALVYGISASGKLRTVYAANFNPQDIVHDVPKLASS